MGTETHWEFFLAYMTSPAGQFDTILPSYLRRSICFESSLTGSGRFKIYYVNLLTLNLIEENKSLKPNCKKI
jgi:hypothetical protein